MASRAVLLSGSGLSGAGKARLTGRRMVAQSRRYFMVPSLPGSLAAAERI